jgi:diguanylate cyclase
MSHPMQVATPTSPPGQEKAPVVAEATATPAGEHRERIHGLSNRDTFFADVDRRVSEWKRGGAPLSVLFVEVDRFQEIETEFGPKAGDVVLRAAAQFLKASMRDMDHISHYDDSLFALLLPGAGITEACAASERIRNSVARCQLPVHGEKLTFTVSLGAAEIAPGEERQDLVSRAQSSLDAAIAAGGNCSFSTTKNGECRSMALSS